MNVHEQSVKVFFFLSKRGLHIANPISGPVKETMHFY